MGTLIIESRENYFLGGFFSGVVKRPVSCVSLRGLSVFCLEDQQSAYPMGRDRFWVFFWGFYRCSWIRHGGASFEIQSQPNTSWGLTITQLECIY